MDVDSQTSVETCGFLHHGGRCLFFVMLQVCIARPSNMFFILFHGIMVCCFFRLNSERWYLVCLNDFGDGLLSEGICSVAESAIQSTTDEGKSHATRNCCRLCDHFNLAGKHFQHRLPTFKFKKRRDGTTFPHLPFERWRESMDFYQRVAAWNEPHKKTGQVITQRTTQCPGNRRTCLGKRESEGLCFGFVPTVIILIEGRMKNRCTFSFSPTA